MKKIQMWRAKKLLEKQQRKINIKRQLGRMNKNAKVMI